MQTIREELLAFVDIRSAERGEVTVWNQGVEAVRSAGVKYAAGLPPGKARPCRPPSPPIPPVNSSSGEAPAVLDRMDTEAAQAALRVPRALTEVVSRLLWG